MLTLNKIQITGRVGSIKIQDFQGARFANLTIAVTERFKKDGQPVEETTWFSAVVNGKSVDFVDKFIVRGDLVYIEGRLKERTYTDRDGIERKAWEVRASEIQIVLKKSDNTASGGNVEEKEELQF